jgi:hypothetical protein
MTIEAARRAIDAELAVYRNRLDTIPDEQFDLSPKGGGWSYAEVYSHILQATLSSAIAIQKCSGTTLAPTSRGRTLLGLLVLTSNRFPPVRVKVPDSVNARMPAKKISKEDARNLIIKCRQRVNEVAPLIADSSARRRINHPRFGMLNARQWFKFIGIHLNHHIKQLNRIEKKFRLG